MGKRPISCDLSADVRCLWRAPSATRHFRCAVSLHSHTMHSREGLDFIPRVMRKIGFVHPVFRLVDSLYERRMGRTVGYERAFWRPPRHPQAAYNLEADQIRGTLGLEPLVSITDHDELEACRELRAIDIPIPYSLEWTVPYGATVFHLGIHNLPPDSAALWLGQMARYSAQPREALLREILAALDDLSDVLVVLNHPFLTEERCDRASHVRSLMDFLAGYGRYTHALELNGLQPASANCDVVRLSCQTGIPV